VRFSVAINLPSAGYLAHGKRLIVKMHLLMYVIISNFLQEKAVETIKQRKLVKSSEYDGKFDTGIEGKQVKC
jgi:hypothetical protein